MNDIREILYKISSTFTESMAINQNLIKDARYIILSISLMLIYMFVLPNLEDIKGKGHRTIYWINGQLKMSKRLKIFDRIEKAKRMGALNDFPYIDIPIVFIGYHLITGLVIGGGVFVIMHILIEMDFTFAILGGFIGLLFGWWFFDHWMKKKNEDANSEITQDVLILLNILSSQITGGQYTGTALGECSDIVKNKRFKRALEEFQRDINTGNTLIDAVRRLDKKFEGNLDVDNLCLVLMQNEESGRTKDILADLSRQIMSSEKAVYNKTKEKLDRYMTYAVIMLFADIAGYVMWLFMNAVTESINFTF